MTWLGWTTGAAGQQRAGIRLRQYSCQAVLAAFLIFFNASPVAAADGFPEIAWQQMTAKQGLLSDRINRLLAHSGKLYIGTPKGLNVFSPASKTMVSLTARDGLPNNNVLSFWPQNDKIWIGTEKGLAFYQNGKLTQCLQPEGLRSLRINAVEESRDKILLGTPQGLFAFSRRTQQLETIQAAKGQDIVCMKRATQGLIVSCRSGRIFIYDDDTQKTDEIEMEFNSLKHPANGILDTGDYIWFSTEGSGLVGYDFIGKIWVSLTRALELDTFIYSVAADGDYLWFGSFAGLYCYHQMNKKWWLLEDKRLTGGVISSLEVMDNRLWVGTNGQGILYGSKPWPSIRLELSQRYFEQEPAVLRGTFQGQAPFKSLMTYTAAASPVSISTGHILLSNRADSCQARIDFSEFHAGLYEFSLQVIDARGARNSTHFTLGKLASPLIMDFENLRLRPGKIQLRGKYKGKQVKSIVFYPGKILAQLTPAQNKFSADLLLQAEDQYLKAEIFDPYGQKKVYTYKVMVDPLPKIDVQADSVVFTPEYDAVVFRTQAWSPVDVENCRLVISDSAGNTVYASAQKSKLPEQWSWNARDFHGRILPAGQLFFYYLQIKEKSGVQFTTGRQMIRSSDGVLLGSQKVKVIPVSDVFYFASGKSRIRAADRKKADKIARYFSGCADYALLVEGHTDSVPIHSFEYASNQKLSEVRAEKVGRFLRENLKIADDRILTVGFGTTCPKFTNQTFFGRSKNRRVEVSVLKKEEKR